MPEENDKGEKNHMIHHGISAQEIKGVLTTLLSGYNKTTTSPEEKARIVKQVENYLNKTHIKSTIETIDRERSIVERGRKTHGTLIYAAIVNNPYNLFHGVEKSYRADDPHHQEPDSTTTQLLKSNSKLKHDKPLIDLQSDEYKKNYEEYVKNKSLETFGNLSQNSPVFWKGENGKYTAQHH